MTKNEMMDAICKRLGLEHKYTIIFFEMCENTDLYTDDMIIDAYIVGMTIDIFEDEDEE